MEKITGFRGLLEFVAAADAGSFSGAARQLGVSVAHVSRQVAELERGLGIQLVQRTTRRSVLTDAGREFYQRCRLLLDGFNEAREAIRSGGEALQGVIRITIGGHFAEAHLTPALAGFAALNPGVVLDVEATSRNVSLVEEGYDFAVRAGPLPDSNLLTRKLVSFPLVTLASPELASRIGPLQHPDQLRHEDCLSLGKRRWVFHKDGESRVFRPLGRIESNSGTLLVNAAVDGVGLAQVPSYYGREELKRGTLVKVFDDWTSDEPFRFFIVYPNQRHLTARTRALIDYLVANVAA
jgi:DNA-binding transcriptional LysR family regulator